ncbi:hypothetical protein JCM1840_001749 [Sporobolomyces johnsonii]
MPALDPPALRLPPELWFLILSQFQYRTLKRVARTCKQLRHMVQSPVFASMLFLQGLPDPAPTAGSALEITLRFRSHQLTPTSGTAVTVQQLLAAITDYVNNDSCYTPGSGYSFLGRWS